MYLSRSALERRLRAVPRAGRVDFWAAVWRARGATVERSEEGFVAQFPDGERERVAVDPPSLAAVLAAPADRLLSHAPTVTPPGATQVGPAERHELVLYGIDRETLDDLLGAHLDTSLAALASEPPTPARSTDAAPRSLPRFGGESEAQEPATGPVDDGVSTALSGEDAPPDRSDWHRDHRQTPPEPDDGDARGVGGPVSLRATLLVALSVALVLAAVVAGVYGVGPDSSGDAVAGSGTPRLAPAGEDSVTQRYPVGMNATGVTDAVALSRRHGDILNGRSYRVVTTFAGLDDPAPPEGTYQSARRVVRVESRRVYTERLDGVLVANGTPVDRDVYADGELEYTRVGGSGDPTYARARVTIRSDGDSVYTARGERYVSRYLAAPNTTVSTLDEEARETTYRVRATGAPPALPNATNYTAVAVVTESGLVTRLTVSYRPGPGEPPVEFTIEYTDLGSVDVPAPAWYGDAVAATERGGTETTNATTTASLRVGSQ